MTADLHAEYDQDFQAWIDANVYLLREGRLGEADIEHIAEELESMGKRDLRQLKSRLQVLLMHLLKWQFQPARQSKSCLMSIDHQRDEIEALLLDSPSLRPRLDEMIERAYAKAVRDASRETDLPEERFPKTCPYGVGQVLAEGFLPD